ncbi:MAG: D-glycero-alpha-D-manno-heptose-7-phosphate kinase [Thermoanaerobaculia bacterium]|jgi:D-glycero-alpha-D-manno-heptose-7-phosphate kinase|nr:D-glycero-alpha-D-manno-heptose-7-phosphate kinase [Thermoanaerobaculia bacterium]
MKKVIVRAPVRADLAGGTLDLWPLYLFHPGSRTVNVAISYHAESEVVETGDEAIDIHLTDQGYEQRYQSIHELSADPKAALIHRALEHFRLTGIRITTRTDAPRGSGLGGSSALTITLVRALSELAGAPVEGDDLIALVRDLETRLLQVPAGIQDYYPPVYGGLMAIHLNPGAVLRHPIALPVERLAEHMLLHYTGIAHFSGTNNWDIYKRQIDGKKKIHKGLDRIAESAIEMEKALESGDMQAAGVALGHEWENRKALIDGISTPEIESAITAAIGAGAWAGKVCGAGGGGCIVFLMPPDRREEVREALGHVPGQVIDAQPVAHGLTIERSDDSPKARPRFRMRSSPSLEQLYVFGGSGAYKPHLLAEAIITQSEPRSGVRIDIVRSFVAPMHAGDGTVRWTEARTIEPEKLDIRAVPDPNHEVDDELKPETLMQGALLSEDAFRTYVSGTAKLAVFHNRVFDLYSQQGENRQSFLQRCSEEARRRINDEQERLESTFRRRIDQVKERSERDQRERDASDETLASDRDQDVNVAWGQTLYNITSGKPSALDDSPHSVREDDYLSKIRQIQRSWDKELQVIREELELKAREIEEIVITPSAKNIEITKYLILWAAGL